MSLSSEKLWQTLLAGIVLANANSMSTFGQSPQPIPSAAWPQPDPGGAWPQPQYGVPTAGIQPAQPDAWEYSVPTPSGYSPPTGCQQCMVPPTYECSPSPTHRPGLCYRPFSGLIARGKSGFDRCRHSCKMQSWTEYEIDCPAAPLGAAVAEHRNVVRAEAHYAGMVLYRYDFVDGSEQLNRKGRERLVEISPLLATTALPLAIEDVPEDPTLATLRRERVLLDLQQRPFSFAPERVIVRSATWPQLRGEESELLHRRLLRQTTNGGPTSLGATSSFTR